MPSEPASDRGASRADGRVFTRWLKGHDIAGMRNLVASTNGSCRPNGAMLPISSAGLAYSGGEPDMDWSELRVAPSNEGAHPDALQAGTNSEQYRVVSEPPEQGLCSAIGGVNTEIRGPAAKPLGDTH